MTAATTKAFAAGRRIIDPDNGNTLWRMSASCRTDPDMWFSDNRRDIDQARRECRGCPVKARCLAWAVATDQRYGVWGGEHFGQCREAGCLNTALQGNRVCQKHTRRAT